MLQINGLKLSLDDDEEKLRELIRKKLKTDDFSYRILRKSLDARKEPVFSCSVAVKVNNEKKYLKDRNILQYSENDVKVKPVHTEIRPVITGYGPSGIFAAYRLLQAGVKSIVFEKGLRISERKKDVERFFKEGIFNPESNVAFGEGGAGTFSDAKLTTRVKDPHTEYILDAFIKAGADEEIRYLAHPHIGSDRIIEVITKMTDEMASKGVEFHFGEEVKELLLDGNHKCLGVRTSKGEYRSPYTLLCIGHSAYELIKTLNFQGVHIEAKDLAIGFRVEHPQKLINRIQYHGLSHPKLPVAEYFLRYKGDKGIYSFCMCPGGFVIPSNSDEHSVCTNGMSNHLRDNSLANSAILIQVNKEEFGEGNLSGFDYIHEYERKAYEISGSYKAIAMNIKDFMKGELNELIFPSSYPLGTVLYDFNKFFKENDLRIMKEALNGFDSKMPGFIEEGIMVGPEMRSSSPVRINRDDSLQSVNTPGLYPCGEGAGYGGGIMSCALDGIRIADKILEDFRLSSQ